MNVKKIIAVAMLGLLAGISAACSGGGGPTPTRTPRALADNGNATQTPWIIYLPVTTTPEPMTITPLPTVTSSRPTPKPTNTRAAVVVNVPTKAPPSPTEVALTSTPAATATPSCGQTYAVTTLLFPENGTTRTAKPGSGAGATIQFKFTPVVGFQIDPKIGYMVYVQSFNPTSNQVINSTAVYVSHNGFLANGQIAILSQQATYQLTNGDDVTARWNVTVVRADGGFDDNAFTFLGSTQPTPCGPASPSWLVNLHVQ